jgi:predicted kinase
MLTRESYRRSRERPAAAASRIALVEVGSAQTCLIVLRGNSGSGKSAVARALRDAYGRGLAWVAQDLIRRTILRELDMPGGANIGLIDQVSRYCLDNGYHVVIDGILYADRYEQMLAALNRDHRGRSCFYYLDVSLEETIRRHATRRQAASFGADTMRDWYRARDLLAAVPERVIPETSSLAETVRAILAESQVLATPGASPAASPAGSGAGSPAGSAAESAAGSPAESPAGEKYTTAG